MTRLVPQAAARHPCGLRLWILAIHAGPDAPPDATDAAPGAETIPRLAASAVLPGADATAQRQPPDAPAAPASDLSMAAPLVLPRHAPATPVSERSMAAPLVLPRHASAAPASDLSMAAPLVLTPHAPATAAPPAGLSLPSTDTPALSLLLQARDAGLLLLVADGPPGPGPALRLALVDQADRARGTALLPDPPPADPSAALASAPRLGLALLAGAARDARLAPLVRWLEAWAAALPAAAGEALADPAGHLALRLPSGTAAPLALLPRPDGGFRPAPLPPGPMLDRPAGLLLRRRLQAAPAAIVVLTADGPARLAVARCSRPALDQAVAAAVLRLAPDHPGSLAPGLPATSPQAGVWNALDTGLGAAPLRAPDLRGPDHPPPALAAGDPDAGAEPPPTPRAPGTSATPRGMRPTTDPAAMARVAWPGRPPAPRPAILLAAGVESPFARRLLFLLAQDLAREVAEVLLFGADPRAEAAWLRPRFPIPVRAAPPLWQARARAALGPGLLLPIGPSGLAALATGDAAALRARATGAARLLALADALGDDEAAVLDLAGEAA
jgi:hypothetical protein